MFKASYNCVQYRNGNHKTGKYFLKLNHMADYTLAEVEAKMQYVQLTTPPAGAKTAAAAARFAQAHGVLDAAVDIKMESGARVTAEADTRHVVRAGVDVPESWDWRDRNGKNHVTRVGYQGFCGDCYAWSGKTAVESAWSIAGNNLQLLSAQQLTDCTQNNIYNKGCSGGNPSVAIEALKKSGGFCRDGDYPDIPTSAACKQ
jgi:C1A family cysteine protease